MVDKGDRLFVRIQSTRNPRAANWGITIWTPESRTNESNK